ncbi:phosphotransferase family protein [Nocardioides sp. YJ-D4]
MAVIQRSLEQPWLTEHDRDRPTTAVVAGLQEAFPTESEYDRVLTRKMMRRSELQTSVRYDLERLLRSLDLLLEQQLDGGYTVRDPRWLTGGASKIQVGFTLETFGHDGIAERQTERLVLRMEPQESLNATSRLREFSALEAMRVVVPVPEVRWVDEHAEWFPEPALIYSWIPGSPKPSRATSRIAGIGINYGPQLRAGLAAAFVDNLARIHAHDVSRGLPHYDLPALASTETALWQVNRARRVWEEDRGEHFPLLDVAASWLTRNLPELDHVSLVHGDYRGGNFMFDEERAEITGILDWERSHLGDRHRDLAWTSLPAFGHRDERTREFLVAGLLPTDEFFDRYESVSGLTVDPDRLRFYRILNCYQAVVTATGSAYRVSKLRRSHQDVVLTGLEAVAGVMAEQLRLDLTEVL